MFFNSPYGYRGQYLIGAAIGQRANAHIVASIARPIARLIGSDVAEQVLISVTKENAKIWIDEDQHDPPGPDLVIQVLVESWIEAAKAVRARLDQHESGIPPRELDRIYGIKAPAGSKLSLMGAWVAPDGSLGVVRSKLKRSDDIHDFGIS